MKEIQQESPKERDVEVRVLRSLAELEEIRPFWESWPGNRDSDIDFYLTVLGSSPEILRPHVIVVSRGGRPDAILVGRIDRRRLNFRIGYARIQPQADILYFVYGASRGNVSPENSELLVREACKSLSNGEANLAYLNFLKPDSDIYRFVRAVPGYLCRDHVGNSQSHYSRVLPGSLAEFQRGLTPKHRKNQRYYRKKLADDYADSVKIRCFQKVEELETLVRDAEQVARTSYQRGLGVGFADNPPERERLQLKARKGWLRAYVLYLADRPCAFWIGDINQGVFGSDYLAFDPAYSKYSPGMYLILKVLEGFCDADGESIRGVDFATGQAEYKETLSSNMWVETCFYIFAPSLKGVGLNLLNTSAGSVDKLLKGVLERTGLLQKIKKAWRGRLRSDRESGEPARAVPGE